MKQNNQDKSDVISPSVVSMAYLDIDTSMVAATDIWYN